MGMYFATTVTDDGNERMRVRVAIPPMNAVCESEYDDQCKKKRVRRGKSSK